MTLTQAAKVYKANEELLKYFRLLWKYFGGKNNQVDVKLVMTTDELKRNAKQLRMDWGIHETNKQTKRRRTGKGY